MYIDPNYYNWHESKKSNQQSKQAEDDTFTTIYKGWSAANGKTILC